MSEMKPLVDVTAMTAGHDTTDELVIVGRIQQRKSGHAWTAQCEDYVLFHQRCAENRRIWAFSDPIDQSGLQKWLRFAAEHGSMPVLCAGSSGF